MSCHDADCCVEAREAADEHIKVDKVAEMHRIVESDLGRLPASSPAEKSMIIQTLVTIISAKFSVHSSRADANFVNASFQKMNVGLVELVESGASALCLFFCASLLKNCTYTLLRSSLIIASACSI